MALPVFIKKRLEKIRDKLPSSRHVPLETALRAFREILEKNTRALGIIADMGEKLGGDYIFDINFIRSSYSELMETVYSSFRSFNVLTAGKYDAGIQNAISRIDGSIRAMIYYKTSSSKKMVLPLEDVSWERYGDVGNKAANIAELKNAVNLPAPDGFVITISAFDEFIEHNGLGEKIRAAAKDNEFSKKKLNELRALIMDSEMPASIEAAIGSAVRKVLDKHGKSISFAVRSSAEEEDGESSFAGQFETVLNVPADIEAIQKAYKKVASSLFSERPAIYQRLRGIDIGSLKMAVCCMVMIDASSSGVIYTSNPEGCKDTVIINASWGLGSSVVEGQTDADLYTIKKGDVPELTEERTGSKESMIIRAEDSGTRKIKTPDNLKDEKVLSQTQIAELSVLASVIERHFRWPQDIEWAIDKSNRIFILQTRPLIFQGNNMKKKLAPPEVPAELKPILLNNRGFVVQRGTASGRVFVLKNMNDFERLPRDSVLVSRYDSPDFVRAMPLVSAIITDKGMPTGHLAAICREFKVPAVVNTGNASEILQHGQAITIITDDSGNTTIYEGKAAGIMELDDSHAEKMNALYEFRRKRYIMRYISLLNLVDPMLPDFAPESCKTTHDILRYIHQKSVDALAENARAGGNLLKSHAAVELELPVPAGIIAIDIGGGLSGSGDNGKAALEHISSAPLRAVIEGMAHPGAWHQTALSIKIKDILSGISRMPDIASDAARYIGCNLAIISRDYANLSIRFGYHYAIIDAYCSSNSRDNHIFFRFVGGATDLAKRSRRARLVGVILKEYGFSVTEQKDLIIGRLANIDKPHVIEILSRLGRLLAFTRQLDVLMLRDEDIDKYAKSFRGNIYKIGTE